jgi:3-dehydroquinate synthase
VVLQDPREENLRKILNYGHTLGHAIESYFLEKTNGTPLLHGEAIGIGMILEAYLSHKLCGLEETDLQDIKATFLHHYPKVSISGDDINNILELLKYDKKNAHGRINFVLLKSIGEPEIDVIVPGKLFAGAFAYYME